MTLTQEFGKIRIFFLSFCFVLPSLGFCQKYRQLYDYADSLYKNKQFCEAALIFKKAYNTGKHNHTFDKQSLMVNIACCYGRCGILDSTIIYLEKAIESGVVNEQYIIDDEDIKPIIKGTKYIDLLQKRIQEKKLLIEKFNTIKNKLEFFLNEDQAQLAGYNDTLKKYSTSSKEFENYLLSIETARTPHRLYLANILDSIGFVGADLIGINGVISIVILIQHADLTFQQKYFDVLKRAVQQEKVDASTLALLEDRLLVKQNKKQKYGSQLNYDSNKGCYVLAPLENIENVNVLRENLELVPLESYLLKFNVCK